MAGAGAATASVQWTDEVLLRSIEGRWLIDDFIHGGDWQFSVPGSMKRMLRTWRGCVFRRDSMPHRC